MCKPICWTVAWLSYFLFCATLLGYCSSYIYLFYFDADRFEKSDFNSDRLRELEFLSLLLGGTGLLLIYLQLKEKLLLCFWIIFFVLSEIEIYFLIFLEASRKLDLYSIEHIFHTGFTIYCLVLVYGKYSNQKFRFIKDTTCQVGQGEP